MNMITNERLREIETLNHAHAVCGDHFTCESSEEGRDMARELLRLREALMEIAQMKCTSRDGCGAADSAANMAEDALGGYAACRALLDAEKGGQNEDQTTN